jgi:hypothetical protein
MRRNIFIRHEERSGQKIEREIHGTSQRRPPLRPGGFPSFSPLMRQTNCVLDRAGHGWAINNWKPDFDTEVNKEISFVNPSRDVTYFRDIQMAPRRSIASIDGSG